MAASFTSLVCILRSIETNVYSFAPFLVLTAKLYFYAGFFIKLGCKVEKLELLSHSNIKKMLH